MRLLLIILIIISAPASLMAQLEGAWSAQTAEGKVTYIFADRYFAATCYDVEGKKFISTWGGTWEQKDGSLLEKHEFNTADPSKVGMVSESALHLKKNKLERGMGREKFEFTRVDDGTPGKLAGAWLITGRVNEGRLQSITPGARRTMKILSGTRFQWIAYNTETKEFFGTGGGTYMTTDDEYVETLEFFSRDSNRVGSSLKFNFKIEEGRWRHSGLSSKGDPIDEYWSKRATTGI